MSVAQESHRSEAIQAALYAISEAAHDAQDLQTLYRTIHQILSQLMPANNIYIALYDAKTNIIRFPYFVDGSDEPPPPRVFSDAMTEYLLRKGTAVLASPEEFEVLLATGDIRAVGTVPVAWLGVPLEYRNELIGALVLQSYETHVRYTEEDKRLLSFVGRQVAVAIERKRHDVHLERVSFLQRELLGLTRNGFLNNTRVSFYQCVLEVASRAIPGAEGGGFAVKREDGRYHLVAATNLDLNSLRSISFSLEDLAWGLHDHEPRVLEKPTFMQHRKADQPGALQMLSGNAGSHAVLVTPIRVDGEVFGVMFTDNASTLYPFTDGAIELAGLLGEQVATLLTRLQLEEQLREQQRALERANRELQRLASHDALTGLPNRLLLRDRLEQALTRVQRRDGCVAVCFLDLDGFKQVNDTLGHAAGDELLKQVAHRLQELVRESDTVARLGGDEFTLILPELPHPQAAALIAERIIHVLSPPFHLGTHDARVTASVGVACYPEHADDGALLLQRADAAMYEAKRLGKNQYVVYVPQERHGAAHERT